MKKFKKIILKTDDEDDFKLKIFITDFNKSPLSNTKRKEILFHFKKIIFQYKILLNIIYELKTSLFYINKIEQEKNLQDLF